MSRHARTSPHNAQTLTASHGTTSTDISGTGQYWVSPLPKRYAATICEHQKDCFVTQLALGPQQLRDASHHPQAKSKKVEQ